MALFLSTIFLQRLHLISIAPSNLQSNLPQCGQRSSFNNVIAPHFRVDSFPLCRAGWALVWLMTSVIGQMAVGCCITSQSPISLPYISQLPLRRQTGLRYSRLRPNTKKPRRSEVSFPILRGFKSYY